MTFASFLENKPLYYKEIDPTRIVRAYAVLHPHIRHPKTVHIVGTNGKGSTGRMLAYLAWRQGVRSKASGERGYCVGHYTSPHILRFNERIWMDGANVSDAVLETAHQKLYAILGRETSEALSYFEYTTLLAFVVFEACDVMVLEAGLGGEYDATNVCDKVLSVITPIGIDHQAFLGETIEEIAQTKINSIQKRVLLAPQPYRETVVIAKEIAKAKEAKLLECTRSNPTDEREKQVKEVAKEKGWGAYLVENAMVALQALEILDISYRIHDLSELELFGRFYPLCKNIRIDVGHNPLAAQAIVKAMEPETVLIYNSLDDKEYASVLHLLKPKIKRVEIIAIESQRATTKAEIEKALEAEGFAYREFHGEIDEREHYLVFGSFYTVEAFLHTIGFQYPED